MQAVFPVGSTIAVVAEGEFEPRSIGSYQPKVLCWDPCRLSIGRLYRSGTVRPGDGTIETLKIADLDRDATLEIIVVMRSVGTGGYVSADAFELRQGALTFLAAVSGLAKDADPIRRLEAEIAERGITTMPDKE